MAISIKQRGKKYTFTFYYKDENGINRQQYEAYSNLDKADERAKMIEFLKWKNDDKTLLQLVNEYNANKAGTKTKHYSKMIICAKHSQSLFGHGHSGMRIKYE